MAESLNVIALISGGKDSFFSILHCLKNGHKVVALGNLYPGPPSASLRGKDGVTVTGGDNDDEHDLNSFMYQTVGHTVIPLYEQALEIPLYRQPITGTAIQTGTSYSNTAIPSASISPLDATSEAPPEDETESLLPLLRRIIAAHPTANALSTGAILSTYQRTRIESVALRLALTPLSYLWKYPILSPHSQTSLLRDMQDVGLDARIVKVASGGMDESFLWANVADEQVVRRVEQVMRRFGVDGDGAVLGEGGEFETLVLDGPGTLFKGRIEIREEDRRIVREGGGAAWLRIRDARMVMKYSETRTDVGCRVPELLEARFEKILKGLDEESTVARVTGRPNDSVAEESWSGFDTLVSGSQAEVVYWAVSSKKEDVQETLSSEASQVITQIQNLLHQSSLDITNVVSTLIILRTMADFAAVNKIYGSLFMHHNPPARVTISCGSALPPSRSLTIYLKIHTHPLSPSLRRALHVQSRSYWAPANIGPYSQAISIPLRSLTDQDPPIYTASIAGQIALLPASMALPSTSNHTLEDFKLQTVLALQHLFRIGSEMHISWFTSCVAYLCPSSSPSTQARIAGCAWAAAHVPSSSISSDDESRDLWEEKHYAGRQRPLTEATVNILPDWDAVVLSEGAERGWPPMWSVEVEGLPRGAMVEWHAHLGVSGGLIKVREREEAGRWTLHECAFSTSSQIILQIPHASTRHEVDTQINEAFAFPNAKSLLEKANYLTYLDVSIDGLVDSERFKGIVPCRSIWGAEGARLAAVLLFDV